ncbi:hypothetical protein CCMA1212_005991 [Trichoderma ghanense]|uniref:Uncharacterized protein n=1 Tax=Trichoderma ghanense TaxID=65468 RepID=A0ABY2H151_9HYPO
MTLYSPPVAIKLSSNYSPGEPRRFEPHQPSTSQSSFLLTPFTNPPEPSSWRTLDIFDIRDENITEAEAYERLTTYIVIRIERATDLYDVDSKGNALPPTWEKASHSIRRDVSQQDARRKVRKLDKETGSVADKKRDLPSAIQRQLEDAWKNLEKTEGDPRFVYVLAQVDWKLKGVESGGRERKRDRRYKDKKRSRERHGFKTKREWVSVTAYFRREPGRDENCVRILGAQLAEGRQGGRGAHDDHLPMTSPGRPPLPRNVQVGPPRIQTRQSVSEPQLQRRLSLNQSPNNVPHHNFRSVPPPPSQNSSAASIPIPSRSIISQAIEAQNRRVQSHAPKLERQATARLYIPKSSITSFSSSSPEDSGTNMTPRSSLQQSHAPSPPPPHLHQHHHQYRDRSRGRSSYCQHSIGDESVVLKVARPQRRHNTAVRLIDVPPAAPDPINAVSEEDKRRRVDQRTHHDGMATSIAERSAPRQPRGIEDAPEVRGLPCVTRRGTPHNAITTWTS